MKKNYIIVFFISFIFLGCNKEKSPKETLGSYIKYRFSENQSKNKLLAYTTGVLEAKISQMSEEDFKNFIDISKYKMKDFKIVLSKCVSNQCYLTYLLKYAQGASNGYDIEIKKIAELSRIDKTWKISDVNSVKSFINAKENIDITPE